MQTITEVVTWAKMEYHSGLVGFISRIQQPWKQITNAGQTLKKEHELQIIFLNLLTLTELQKQLLSLR